MSEPVPCGTPASFPENQGRSPPSPRPGRAVRRYLPALLAGGGFLWLFSRPLFAGETFFRRDIQRIFYPAKRYLADALAGGELPQWWPYDGLGLPFLGVPLFSTFHPSTLFFLVAPFDIAFLLQVLTGPLLALAGTTLLARSLGMKAPAAAVAAVSYAFGGYGLGLLEYTFSSLAAGAFPFFLWGCARPGRTRDRIALGGLGLAGMLLAGDPHLAIMAVLTAAMLLGGWDRAGRRGLSTVVLATGLGAGLAAVQLLPTFLILPETARGIGKGIAAPDYWNLGLAGLREFFAPPSLVGASAEFIESTYLGLTTVALAGVGALASRRWGIRLGSVVLLFLLLATGSTTPLWNVFSTVIPLWKAFQFPMKAIGPAVLAAGLLAGLGAQTLVRDWRARRKHTLVLAALAIGLALAGKAWAALGIALCLGGLLYAAPRSRLLWSAPLGLVLLDLLSFNTPLVRTTDPSFWRPPELASALADAGVGLEGGCFGDAWQPAARRGVLENEAAVGAALLPCRGALYGLPGCDPYVPGYSARYRELVSANPPLWVARLSGVFGNRIYLMNERMVPLNRLPLPTDRLDEGHDVAAVEVRRFLPRAYVAESAIWLPRGETIAYLTSDNFRPGREVVLEGSGPTAPNRDSALPAIPVERLRRTARGLQIEATLAHPGFLVVNDAWFTGIQAATQDGRRLPVLPANHVVQAVALPAGKHQIELWYETPGLGAALALSGLAAAIVAGLLVPARLSSRSSRRTGPARGA